MQCNPSNAYRWMNCAVYPWFAAQCEPTPQTDAMREGTCAAWVAEMVLKGHHATAKDLAGKTHPNGWVVTPDMVNNVQGYIDHIRSLGGQIATEQNVRLGQHIEGRLDTSNHVVNHVLYIRDYKNGLEIVEIEDNPAMIIYGAGEYLRLNDPSITHVDLGIYQPRAFHPDGILRTWPLTVAELMVHAQKLVDASERVQQPNPLATPGPWCSRCEAATSCAALSLSLYKGYAYIEDSRQRHMTREELVRELDALDMIATALKARKGAVEAEAEQRIAKGEHLPGWHMEQGYGNRFFTVPPAVVTLLTGINATDEKTKTPAEMERLGASPAVIKQIAVTPRTSAKLKRIPKGYFEKVFKQKDK